jgi:glycosyltransferase involved in cell wall biosynthesis
MTNKPLVSVIVPVYNSERYLLHAVESVLAQSYDNLELVLVDDGSPDGSGKLCDEFAERDDRVVVVHKENGGICSARNAGLDVARGDYLTFCDNDDEYLPGLLEDNVRIAQEYDVDVVRFLREHLIVRDGEVLRRDVLKSMRDELSLISEDDIASKYYELYRYGCGVWTGMYRRDLVEREHLRFPETMRFGYEDLYFNLLVTNATSSFAINPQVYYRWIDRFSHSTSRKFNTNRLDSLRECLRLEGEICEKHGLRAKDPAAWTAYLVDTYVMRLLQQITVPTCDLPTRERVHQIRLFADEPVMEMALADLPSYGRSLTAKQRLAARLMRRKRCGLLLRIFVLNARLHRRVY